MLKQHLYEHGEDCYEKQGFWWLPSNAEHKVPGTLVFGHDADAELRLLGSMQESFDALRSLGGGGSEFRPEIILGTTSDGKDYTLIDSVRSGFKMSAYIIESFLPSVVIEGRHFSSRSDVVFQELAIRLAHLSEWYGRTGREVIHNAFGNELSELTLKYRKPAATIASFGSGQIEIGHDTSVQFARFGGDFVISEEASMCILPEGPLHLDEIFEKCLSPLTGFVALGTARSLSIRELRAKSAGDCQGKTQEERGEAPTLQLYWKKKRYRGEDKELFPHDMLYTCSDLGDDLEKHLTRWVETYHAIEPVMQLFFGRVLSRDGISSNSFLNAVQAAEAYHRYRRDGSEVPKPDHKKRLAEILDGVPQEHQQWLNQKLSFSNEKSLGQRLTELLEEHADVLSLGPDEIVGIVKRTKDLRNFFTHYSDQKKRDFGSGTEFYVLGTLMQWLLIACFLEEMGFSRERAHDLLLKCQPFVYFRIAHLKGQQVQYFKVETAQTREATQLEGD